MRTHYHPHAVNHQGRKAEVATLDLMMLFLIFIGAFVGFVYGIEIGSDYGIWGKVIGGITGPIVVVVAALSATWLLFLVVVEPIDRFNRWWRPYPPVCENGCCESYSDYQSYTIPEDVVKRVKGMAHYGNRCRCGNIYAGGCDSPMLNRWVRVLPNGEVRPYLKHVVFGRWKPDEGEIVVVKKEDSETHRTPLILPGWIIPVFMTLICGGMAFFEIYIRTDLEPHPLSAWFVGGIALLGFVIGCIVWWKCPFE